MPLQNRVDPWSQIHATAARGTLMGNRGVLHDASGTIVRHAQLRRWIICETDFKDWWRPVMTPGRYTELFFLDDVTALAAGHRPCFECRWSDANAFRAAWARHQSLEAPPTAPELDGELDAARHETPRRTDASRLPTGAMFESGGAAWAVHGEVAMEWSFEGYQRAVSLPDSPVTVITNPVAIGALREGFVPRWHPSASRP